MENTISFNTKFGWISVKEINGNIVKIQFGKKNQIGKVTKKLKKLKKSINLYFKNKTNRINIKITNRGSPLQKKIWDELKKIKKGKTRSYKEIAKKIGTSPRYVGRVCGENQHVIIVPCHRVLRSNGEMGGFSGKGGVFLKKKLLKFENAI